MISRHYQKDRGFREKAIKEYFGTEGKVVYSTVKYDSKRKKYFLYEVTENAVLIVKATDKKDFVITKMLARPSRITRVWADAPDYIIQKAVANARDPKRFA